MSLPGPARCERVITRQKHVSEEDTNMVRKARKECVRIKQTLSCQKRANLQGSYLETARPCLS